MTVFVCLDDDNGMLFNNRRQSRDRAVIEDMLAFAGDEKIRMNAYSAKLFEGMEERIAVEDDLPDFLEDCFYFVETVPLQSCEDKIKTLVTYCWNRTYPADVHLDIAPEQNWSLAESKEFAGNSHEKITRKVYVSKGSRI